MSSSLSATLIEILERIFGEDRQEFLDNPEGYLAEHGLLVFEGHAKDDPNLVIGLDRYRLLVANGGDALTGITHSHGTWQGRFTASRLDGRLPPPPAPKGGSGEK